MTTVLGYYKCLPTALVTPRKDSWDSEALVLIGMVYYGERTLTGGKIHQMESGGIQVQAPEFCLWGVGCHKEHISSSSSELQQRVHCLCLGKPA